MKTTDHYPLHDPNLAGELRVLELVRSMITCLSKLISGKKIYAKNNPTLKKFTEDFSEAIKAFFCEESELVLAVEQYELKWRDGVVYKNEKRDESIAFIMHKDGIGEITIRSSVTSGELETFVDLIKDEVHNLSRREDIVTRFWRADFEHISYRVLDEYLVGEFGEGRRAGGDAGQNPFDTGDHPDLPSPEDKGRVTVRATAEIEPLGAYLDGLLESTCQPADERDREKSFQDMLDSFFRISSEELKLCQQAVLVERDRDGLIDFLRVILDFTLMHATPSAVRDVSNVVDCIADFLVAEGNPVALTETLTVLRSFSDDHSIPSELQPFFRDLEGRFTDTSLLLAKGRELKRWNKDAEEIFAFFKTVGRRAIPTLCELLGDLHGPKMHAEACAIIAENAGDDLAQIIDKLDMEDARVARDAIVLVRHLESQEIPQVVRELAQYPDRPVREEAIQYLAERGDQDAAILLVELLDDDDKSIRVKTLAACEKVADPIIGNKLKAMAFDKELAERSFDEQEVLFRALGRICGEGVLPQIKQMLEKKSFLGLARGKGKQSKLLAIRALEQIVDPEAVGLLATLVESETDLVNAKAKRALRAVESALEAQGGVISKPADKEENPRSADDTAPDGTTGEKQ